MISDLFSCPASNFIDISRKLSFNMLPFKMTCRQKKRSTNMHWHDHIQVIYVLSGTIEHIIDGVPYLQKAGSSAIILPYASHITNDFVSENDPVVFTLSFFDSFFSSENIPFFTYDKNCVFFDNRTIPTMKVFSGAAREQADGLVLSLFSEFERHEAMSMSAIRATVYQFFKLLCSDAPAFEPTRRMSYLCDRANRIFDAAHYMSQNSERRLTINDLCSVALMSRHRFTDNFSEVTGYTFSDYLLRARIGRVLSFLLCTDKTLSEIADISGFSSHSHLTNTFISLFGISPSEYRRGFQTDAELAAHRFNLDYWKWLESFPKTTDSSLKT